MTRYMHEHPYSDHPSFGDMTVGDYADGMPNIRIGELIRSLVRQMRWVIPMFLIGIIPAFILTKNIKRTYEGEGRILVQLGSEYVYEDVSGTQAAQGGLSITPDVIALNETAIMKNSEVIEQVIGEMVSQFGEARFAKDAFDKINRARQSGNVQDLANAKVDLHKMMDKKFVVTPQAKSSIVDLVFKHEDGEVAVATLNAFINAYLSYRRTIFVEGSSEVIAEGRLTTEQELQKTEQAISAFLRRNKIADFDSERLGVISRAENLRTELTDLRGTLTETEAALATVETQLRQTPSEINLYIDDRAGQRVAQAELELKQLLAKYLPGSDPVRAKQAEIAELKSLQNANNGNAIGGRRVGPNPVYQQLMTRRNTLASTADSLREKEFELQRQLNQADTKVKKFQSLRPEYNDLMREQNTLDQRLKGYTNKEQEALVNQKQGEAASENVRVISYATLPRKGRDMRKITMALIMLGWGFTLFMIALLRVFIDPRLYINPVSRLNETSPHSGAYHPYGHYAPPAAYEPPSYVPEPVAATPPPPAYNAGPEHYAAQHGAQPYYQAAHTAHNAAPIQAYHDGSAAYDVHHKPYMAGPSPYHAPAPDKGAPPNVIGTVPSSEQE